MLVAHEVAADGVLGVARHASQLERSRIDGREMAGAVDDHDRVLGRCLVEVLTGRVAAFLELVVVVAAPDDPLSWAWRRLAPARQPQCRGST